MTTANKRHALTHYILHNKNSEEIWEFCFNMLYESLKDQETFKRYMTELNLNDDDLEVWK